MTDSAPTMVRCRMINGTLHTLQLTVVGETAITGTLPARMVSVDGGPPLLQKWVPQAPSGRPGPLDPLDREIEATHRFALSFPSHAYPCELPRLRYYDVDSEEPFALLDPYRGEPVAGVLPQLIAQDRYRLQVGLLRALHFVGAVGMTHGRVDLDALRWDARTESVQLVGFEHAARIGEQSTEAAAGEPADIRDDIWDAGLTIWRTAHPTYVGREAPDLTADGGALSTLLAGVFVDPPASRPTARDLLARLREPTQTYVIDLGAPFRPGLHAFDSAVQRKREHRKEDQAQINRATSRWARLRGRLKDSRSPSQAGGAAPSALVRCPVCLDSYPLPDNGLWRRNGDGQYHQVASANQDSLKERWDLVNTYRRCPNPSQDTTEHYLPANYFAHDPPLVVAMVGQPTAGKTHLLAAMIHEAVERNALTPYGLTVVPMDLHRHDVYQTSILGPAGRGVRLPGTPERVTDPASILLIRGRHSTRPLVLFDVAGEDLQAVGDGALARFLIGTDAVIFVHGLEPTSERSGNHALEMSLAKLQAAPNLDRLPAAIVVTKSDRLRYQPPVNHWLRHQRNRVVSADPEQLHLESRDVYAFLHHRQEHGALAPFSIFDRCTLHFVSASGSETAPDKQLFPRGFEPSRVLQPLVAILAMAGILEGMQTRDIGN